MLLRAVSRTLHSGTVLSFLLLPLISPMDIQWSPFPPDVASGGEEYFWRQLANAQYDFCHHACNTTGLVWSSHVDHSCDPCYCDDACSVYGDCCPDKYAALGYRPPPDQELRCSRTQFGVRATTSEYVMVTQCPEPFPWTRPTAEANNGELRAKCETSATSHWNLTQPVTDAATLVTYKNRYCAQCHSVSAAAEGRVVYWEPSVVITDYRFVASLTSAAQLYSAVLEDPVNMVEYRAPESVAPYARMCRGLVSRCNETGLWRHFDINLDVACSLVWAPVKKGYDRLTYKNPFCLVCNSRRSWMQELSSHLGAGGVGSSGQEVPLLLLLDFSDGDKDESKDNILTQQELSAELDCSDKQFFAVSTKSCKDIICSQGKFTKKHKDTVACQSFPKSSNVFGYQICFLDNKNVRDNPNSDGEASLLWLDYIIEGLQFASGQIHMFYGAGDKGEAYTSLYILNMFLKFPVERDATDEAMLTNLTALSDLFREALKSPGLRLAPTCSMFMLWTLLGNDTLPPFYRELATGHRPREYKVPAATVYLPLFKNVICPSVELGPDEFDFDHDANEIIIKQDNKSDTSMRLGVPNFSLTKSNTVLICLSDYRKFHPDNTTSKAYRSDKAPSGPLYWVALISTIVSLVFLFFSFIIYCLFSSLRTVAGINNLVLISALFAAQLLLRVGLDVPLPDWLCQVMGSATHFSWLAVVSAQNACTFHMFYTLSFPLMSHAALANPALLTKKYTAYILLVPAIFVAASLSWQFGAERRSGYGGGSTCFLTELLVRILMFAAPLAVTVVLNVAMFVFTLVRLSKMPRVQSTRSNRTSLVLYTKLSVITGFTWLFGFLSSLLDSRVLAYLFAVLQGCQGLFIFLAFLANKRVLGMVCERVNRARLSGKSQKREAGSSLTTKTLHLTTAANTAATDNDLSGNDHASEDPMHNDDVDAVSSDAVVINSVL